MSTAPRLQILQLEGDQLIQAVRAHRALAAVLDGKKKASVRFVADGSGEVVVPRAVFELFVAALEGLIGGQSMTLVPGDKEMTTQEAADYLNVSRPYLVQLLESGQIPFRKVGSHRRVRFSDLFKYRQVDDRKRAKAAAALTREAEELGLEY